MGVKSKDLKWGWVYTGPATKDTIHNGIPTEGFNSTVEMKTPLYSISNSTKYVFSFSRKSQCKECTVHVL